MLKTVSLLYIFFTFETDTFVFTVTFDQINAYLLRKEGRNERWQMINHIQNKFLFT